MAKEQPSTDSELPKPFRLKKAWNAVTLSLGAWIVFNAACQVAYSIASALQEKNPSAEVLALREKFGVRLKGYRMDIERSDIKQIAAVAHQESLIRPFGEEVVIHPESDRFWRDPGPDLLYSPLFVPPGGTYQHRSDDITISQLELPHVPHLMISSGVLTHEFKHLVTASILEENPAFITQWEEIAQCGEDRPPYTGRVASEFRQFRPVRWLRSNLPEKGQRPSYLEEKEALGRKGLVTRYAGTNAWEDIAELGESALNMGTSPSELSLFVLDESGDFDCMKEKIALAERSGLIPPEASEYARVMGLMHDLYLFDFGAPKIEVSAAPEEIAAAEQAAQEFLDQYPTSIYRGVVAYNYGDLVREQDRDDSERSRRAIEIFEQGLTGPYKGWFGYASCLGAAAHEYEKLGNQEMADRLNAAHDEYKARVARQDVMLTVTGVDDLL